MNDQARIAILRSTLERAQHYVSGSSWTGNGADRKALDARRLLNDIASALAETAKTETSGPCLPPPKDVLEMLDGMTDHVAGSFFNPSRHYRMRLRHWLHPNHADAPHTAATSDKPYQRCASDGCPNEGAYEFRPEINGVGSWHCSPCMAKLERIVSSEKAASPEEPTVNREDKGAERTSPTPPPVAQCPCSRCLDAASVGAPDPFTAPNAFMILCPKCGNKRCPKAAWHGYVCSGSNELNQACVPEDG